MLPLAPWNPHWTMATLVSMMTSEFICSQTHKPIPKVCPGLLRSKKIAGEVSLPLSNGTEVFFSQIVQFSLKLLLLSRAQVKKTYVPPQTHPGETAVSVLSKQPRSKDDG